MNVREMRVYSYHAQLHGPFLRARASVDAKKKARAIEFFFTHQMEQWSGGLQSP